LATEYEGKLNADGMRFGIVVAQFNRFITEPLLKGALNAIVDAGGNTDNVDVVWVPGAFEIPYACKQLIGPKPYRYDAIIALGAVIRGETPHFDYVCDAVTRGVTDTMLQSVLPISFGVVTTNTVEEAVDRCGSVGNKGTEAATAAILLVDVMRQVKG
jgi:6,7-dimethyl-8-ribityllumazine synthase